MVSSAIKLVTMWAKWGLTKIADIFYFFYLKIVFFLSTFRWNVLHTIQWTESDQPNQWWTTSLTPLWVELVTGLTPPSTNTTPTTTSHPNHPTTTTKHTAHHPNPTTPSNRRQTIIWTNADPTHWRIHAALGGDEFTLHRRKRYSCSHINSTGLITHISDQGHNCFGCYQFSTTPVITRPPHEPPVILSCHPGLA